MVTDHFGLDDGPFHGRAEGQDVYVGPQQASVIARFRRVFAIADTVLAVSGPVGVGKTTLIRRALADIAGRKVVITVDRIRLEPDEILELLLARFDVSRQPKGIIQRFAAFRRLLHERLSNDTRVFIIVEDAERVGIDALLELEALTANDSGEPVGANIVLSNSMRVAEHDEDATIEAAALRFEDELALAPDAATDVFGVAADGGGDAEGPAFDVLQAAIRAADTWQVSEDPGDPECPVPETAGKADAGLPEITLDAELEARTGKQKPPPADRDRWAEELSRARSLEDISDMLAETLFGSEEMQAISAEIRAGEDAVPAAAPPPAAAAQPEAARRRPDSAPARAAAPRAPSAPGGSAPAAVPRPQPAPPRTGASGSINMTLSQRIEMVNSLKGTKHAKPRTEVTEIVLAGPSDEPLPSVTKRPESVEAQIDTAITQSRRILSAIELAGAAPPDNDGDDKGSRGLFGFFRRSSKSSGP